MLYIVNAYFQESDQLTIKEGDILSVMEEDEDGWSRGVLDGKEGMYYTCGLY